MLFSVAAGPWEASWPRSLRALVPFPGRADRGRGELPGQPSSGLWVAPQPDFRRRPVMPAVHSPGLYSQAFGVGNSWTSEKEAPDASLTTVAVLISTPPVACCATLGEPRGLIELGISSCQMKGVG